VIVIRRLLEIEHDELDLRLAAYAVLGIVVAIVFEAVVGVGALQAGIAAVVVVMVGRPGDLRTRMVHMGAVTLVGGAFGFLSYLSAETAWQAAIVLGVVTYLTGLASGLGPEVGRAGYLVLIWTLAVLIGQAHGGDPPETAGAFLVGGVAAMVVVGVAWLVRHAPADPDAPAEASADAPPRPARPGLRALVRSDLGAWSLVRAVLTVIAVFIGYGLTTGDLDPFWAPMAVLIVFQTDVGPTVFKAAQRGLGTLVGAATAAALTDVTDSGVLIVVVMLIATFGAIAFYSANYTIYAFFITNAVLLYYWLATDHAASTPGIRLAGTVIGIALAFVGMAALGVVGRARHHLAQL
jgi:uncharacterized membrane protein YccC